LVTMVALCHFMVAHLRVVHQHRDDGDLRTGRLRLGQAETTFDGHQATAAWSMMLKQGGKELERVATVTMVPSSNGLGVTVANIYGATPAKPVHFTFNRSQ
jgi:hypothetical protein